MRTIRGNWTIALTAALVLVGSSGSLGYTLRGSREKMIRQNTVAREDHFEFAVTWDQVQQLVGSGQLVALPTAGTTRPKACRSLTRGRKCWPSCSGWDTSTSRPAGRRW